MIAPPSAPLATPTPEPGAPRREVFQGEALGWLGAHAAPEGASVVTSLPDVSEVPALGFEGWRAWFIEAARQVIRWVPPTGAAIFFQSDIRYHGVWVDKGYLVLRAAEEEGVTLLWHKIVCRRPAGTLTQGRSSYSHMICVSRSLLVPRRPGPDVIPDAGVMTWARAMGVNACWVACRYLRDDAATRTIVDPFCGHGTILAAANALGLDAIGVDLSEKRCRAARRLVLSPP
jgi:hypothetical protein